jgi:hypothetical protein
MRATRRLLEEIFDEHVVRLGWRERAAREAADGTAPSSSVARRKYAARSAEFDAAGGDRRTTQRVPPKPGTCIAGILHAAAVVT